MLKIGLTGWSAHPLIASNKNRKLENYASHFPFVKMDTSYYGIPSEKVFKVGWIKHLIPSNLFQRHFIR